MELTTDFLILMDKIPVQLEEFIRVNSAPDTIPLTLDQIAQLRAIKPGDIIFIGLFKIYRPNAPLLFT